MSTPQKQLFYSPKTNESGDFISNGKKQTQINGTNNNNNNNTSTNKNNSTTLTMQTSIPFPTKQQPTSNGKVESTLETPVRQPSTSNIPRTSSTTFANMSLTSKLKIPTSRASQTPMDKPAQKTANSLHQTAATTCKITSRFIRPTLASRNKAMAPPAAKVPASTKILSTRSSSVLSATSSSHAKARTLPPVDARAKTVAKPTVNNRQESAIPTNQSAAANKKGLTKFTNPIECQRQFTALTNKIKELEDKVDSRDKNCEKLRQQLRHNQSVGVGLAVSMQYLAEMLKLHSDVNLVQEKNNLESQVEHLQITQNKHDDFINTLRQNHEAQLQIEIDVREEINRELAATRRANDHQVTSLKEAHEIEVADLKKVHSEIERKLSNEVEKLTIELRNKTKNLESLQKTYEELDLSFSKLEETLKKDNDSRVKYAQEKIIQLKKEVESLNSVLEMRLERVRVLERDILEMEKVQNELRAHKDTIKSLKQQLESMTAALDRKRELYENLIVEHEKVKQELRKELKEKNRITMVSEQLEYALNESSSESSALNNSATSDDNHHDHNHSHHSNQHNNNGY